MPKDLKKLAQSVMDEWDDWINGPSHFPTTEFLDAIVELCDEILEAKSEKIQTKTRLRKLELEG